jgi:signal peptidase II
MKKNKLNIIFFLVALFAIILDQATKLYFYDYFKVIHKNNDYFQHLPNVSVIGDFLQFVYVENPGMAFGISFGPLKFLLSLFSVFASIALIWYLYKLRFFDKYIQLGIAFILAGATGNLIDRVFYGVIFGYNSILNGRVIDWILFDIPDVDFLGLNYTHFPVFNVADSMVTIGVVFLILFNSRIPNISQLKAGTYNLDKEEIPNQNEDLSGEE